MQILFNYWTSRVRIVWEILFSRVRFSYQNLETTESRLGNKYRTNARISSSGFLMSSGYGSGTKWSTIVERMGEKDTDKNKRKRKKEGSNEGKKGRWRKEWRTRRWKERGRRILFIGCGQGRVSGSRGVPCIDSASFPGISDEWLISVRKYGNTSELFLNIRRYRQ